MNVVRTVGGNCRDCYKCVRFCPLKAIKVEKDCAHIIPEACIDDGLCIQVCPQGAKGLVNQWDKMKALLQGGSPVIISLAPTYLGLSQDPYKFVGALFRAGVSRIEETAWAVPPVSAEYWQGEALSPLITSACPSVVRLIEVHYPGLVDHLAQTVSPMVVHARSIKQRYPDAKVVFIGPCPSKKVEGEIFSDVIDLVLTYSEVFGGLKQMGICVESVEQISPNITGSNNARLFPLQGGWQRSWSGADVSHKLWTVNGFRECRGFLTSLAEGKIEGGWVEMMLCKGGCLGGAGWNEQEDIYVRQSRLMSRLVTHREDDRPTWSNVSQKRDFSPKPLKTTQVNLGEIESLLQSTNKLHPDEQLDCGACGYDTCQEQAAAVLLGKAQIEMCIPYMRAQAESLANVIIKTTPNGIIVVDNDFRIIAVNPAAEGMFNFRQSTLLGKELDTVMDPSHFRLAKSNNRLLVKNVSYPQHSLITREIVFPVENQGVIIGIFVDVTEEQRRSQEISRLKEETIQRAKEVIEKQMRVAQEIAGLLGETTGETKILLSRLIKFMEADKNQQVEEQGENHVR